MNFRPYQFVSKAIARCFVFLLPVLLGAGVAGAGDKDTRPAGDADAAARGAAPGGRSEEGNGKKRGHPARHADRQRAFDEADANKDGFLSPEEFSQMKRLARLAPEKRERLFAFLDRNKDGKLHHHELHPPPPPRHGMLLRQFRRLDADGSGGLSVGELAKSPAFKGTPPEHLDRLFRRLDRNKNGQLEKKELMGGARRGHPAIHFEKYDKDGSGGLSFEEYSAMPFMDRINEERRKKVFERIDADKDGQLSPQEIRQAWRPHHRHRHHKGKPHPPGREGERHGPGGP